jgi:predicted membrane protein
MASLYKHQTIKQRGNIGFVNAAILNEAYVVGANRNYYLNLISILIFGMTLVGITIHAILRVIKNK